MFFYMIITVVFALVHHCVFGVGYNELVETHRFLLLPAPVDEGGSVDAVLLGVVGLLLEVEIKVVDDCGFFSGIK
jgi:hypothetical protein